MSPLTCVIDRFQPCVIGSQVFRPRTPPEAIALCSRLLEYTPTARFTPLEACAHTFFDELRDPNLKLPNGREKPLLFNFSTQGMDGAHTQLCISYRITRTDKDPQTTAI